MSSAGNDQPIENAGDVIEKFGGIRPMSTKTGVAVTTIQGWKKRNVIPANRVDDIKAVAAKHGIDLSGVISDATAILEKAQEEHIPVAEAAIYQNFEDTPAEKTSIVETKSEETKADEWVDKNSGNEIWVEAAVQEPVSSATPAKDDNIRATRSKDYTEIAVPANNRAVAKGALGAAGIILVILIAAIAMVMPKINKQNDRVAEIEQELSEMKKQQTMFKGLVPEDWSGQLEQLKQELAVAQDAVTPAVDEMKAISGELIAGNSGAIEQRVEGLQSYVNEITKSTSISDLYARLDTMRTNLTGQKNLDQSMSDLYTLYAGLDKQEAQDKDSVNSLLDRARAQSGSLGQTFADVPASDLKAAAMLLTLTQMRSSLNRENEPFAQDLELLMKMTSEDDVELRAALTRLAPYAEQGVLSPAGLSNQFRGLAGDVVVSSLKGEDVSMMDKAQARMNDFLAIEKDGELVSGTPTQAVVTKAQKQLDNGQVAQAVDLLSTNLSTTEIAPLKPWLKQAEALINAQKAENAIKQAIELNLGRGYLGGSQLIRDNSSQ